MIVMIVTLFRARVGDAQRIRGQWRRTAHESLESRRWRVFGDNVADRVDRLIGLHLADVAGQT